MTLSTTSGRWSSAPACPTRATTAGTCSSTWYVLCLSTMPLLCCRPLPRQYINIFAPPPPALTNAPPLLSSSRSETTCTSSSASRPSAIRSRSAHGASPRWSTAWSSTGSSRGPRRRSRRCPSASWATWSWASRGPRRTVRRRPQFRSRQQPSLGLSVASDACLLPPCLLATLPPCLHTCRR